MWNIVVIYKKKVQCNPRKSNSIKNRVVIYNKKVQYNPQRPKSIKNDYLQNNSISIRQTFTLRYLQETHNLAFSNIVVIYKKKVQYNQQKSNSIKNRVVIYRKKVQYNPQNPNSIKNDYYQNNSISIKTNFYTKISTINSQFTFVKHSSHIKEKN